MSPTEPDDPVSAPLAEWRIALRPNPQFRTAVWKRIEAARRPCTWSGFARTHTALVSGLIAVAVILGAWSGRNAARQQAQSDNLAIAASYVHALDPRWARQP